ncbi:AGL367W-Ap [Eremothecium gossypii ATCC 10895]|uniref:Putative ATP synthase protein 8-like protein n=1 Tax=Eremothecium gossypii (strain ATCC 10895 / CBS 109.51 / FGSC 9923 / NRRL Y-1056) TaxID=284811 RepID=ATP8L_EREGS|nr:AGL367W-Ap [Eremothecium gossypii ATCC 10895]Q751Q6.1 RecName: Full=Putative ATP synthase protein 8-like protein [Eremothecium gossypii ATCC 10895]AAS54124.1 AGL367W-Ap [Eremothecium gossypii ATCC 10895]AEY98450.1 FAGL367W-Ap [Eremothecium gossypii FDAG1]
MTPQIIPFFFMHQFTYGFLVILLTLLLLSYAFLSMILRLYLSRIYLSK